MPCLLLCALPSLQCAGWLVVPLNSSMPPDLWAQQWFERGNAPDPISGAHRPVAEAARTACQTFMGDSKVSGGG